MPRYEIQPGETLSSISKKLGVSMSDLVERNNTKSNTKNKVDLER